MPARPSTMAASRRLRSKANVISHASALPLAPDFHFAGRGENLRSVADLRRADLPPCMAALGPCPWVDFYFDHVGAVRALRLRERCLERRDAGYRLRSCAHRAGVHREVDGERGDIPLAIRDLIVERDISGIALEFVDHRKTAVVAHDNDELAAGQYARV